MKLRLLTLISHSFLRSLLLTVCESMPFECICMTSWETVILRCYAIVFFCIFPAQIQLYAD